MIASILLRVASLSTCIRRFPGLRHEIIAGEHYVTASPVTRHQRILLNLAYLIPTRVHLHETIARIALNRFAVAPRPTFPPTSVHLGFSTT